jgi:hypothetical protein
MQVAPESPDDYRPGGPKRIRKPGSGRRFGSKNRFPLDLKKAAIAAAEMHGSDGHGAGGLTGYLYMIADRHPKAFCHLLGKTLPYEIGGTVQSIVSQVRIVSIPADHYLDAATIAKLRPEPSVIEHEAQQTDDQDHPIEPEIEADDRLKLT